MQLKDGIPYHFLEDVSDKGLHKKLQLVLPKQLVTEVVTKLHDATTGGQPGPTVPILVFLILAHRTGLKF